ncbi:cyclase family protein [Candidatus Dependentiae bacterium]|nr:cyclase family protein [Candidatus Dependentiae bacterium]
MKRYLDISWPLCADMVHYKDLSAFYVTQTKNFAEHGMFQSTLCMSSHAGTHIDAPFHVMQDGQRSENLRVIIEAKCKVLDCTNVQKAISADDLRVHNIEAGDIILLKTSNSFLPATGSFEYQFVYLAASGAEYLASKRVKVVGIDYLGLEREQPGHPSHKALLSQGIMIIEGLRLEHAQPDDRYTLLCFPLRIIGLEAAPARAILLFGPCPEEAVSLSEHRPIIQ